MIRNKIVFFGLAALLLTGVFIQPGMTQEPEYLSTEKALGIGIGSLATLALGNWVKRSNLHSPPGWKEPFGLDARVSRALGDQPALGRQNILDSRFGSALTPELAGALLLATDLAYPPGDKTKDVLQTQLIFHSGVIATKGVTDLVKGLVKRQRPWLYFSPELAAERPPHEHNEDNFSFFSGHTSAAFFSMTFLNKRVRGVMRNEMTTADYRRHRWVPSLLTFGWATFVGYSRIEAYRHYLTDVLAAALAGYLMGELFYSFYDQVDPSPVGDSSPLFIQVQFSF